MLYRGRAAHGVRYAGVTLRSVRRLLVRATHLSKPHRPSTERMAPIAAPRA